MEAKGKKSFNCREGILVAAPAEESLRFTVKKNINNVYKYILFNN